MPMRWLIPAVLCACTLGCAVQKNVSITTRPPDAIIKLEGAEVARGKYDAALTFDPGDRRTITVSRLGYKEQAIVIDARTDPSRFNVVELKPLSKPVRINVTPLAAHVSLDGKPLSAEMVETLPVKEVEFGVDARNNWITHIITAERPGFETASEKVTYQDDKSTYELRLEPKKKNLTLTSSPPGATLYLDGEKLGTAPVTLDARPFPPDPDTGDAVPQRLKAEKAGFDPVTVPVGWDNGKSEYKIDLLPKSKVVRVRTTPPGGAVTINDRELPRDSEGVSSVHLDFPPVNDQGELRTYAARVTKKTADSEWYPADLAIAWDDGQADYAQPLREIKTRPVPLLSAELKRADGGWEMTAERSGTVAMKDTGEGPKLEPPVKLTNLPRGSQIDTMTISPDGSQILFTVLAGKDKTDLRSQIQVVKTDGSGGTDYLTDGRTLDVTPSYTADGTRVVYSSNRFGNRMNVCRVAANGVGGIERLTGGDTNDLWPTIDTDPKPRLFYQSAVDSRPETRIFMTQMGTTILKDLYAGLQPAISPKADQIAFAALNEKTGKRDLCTLPDTGGVAQNLTNSQDVDEFDPAWNKDGSRIAFVSDAGVDEEKRHNFDVWVFEMARADRPLQITTNGSWDDHPVWDPSGTALYFRSNRGGEWAIWKVSLR